MGACVELGPRGPYPKRVYTDLRTELVFDGNRIVVEGTSQCTRSENFRSSGKLQIGYIGARGPMYRCSPSWFGKRLADGSALLVGTYSVTGRWGTFPDYTPPDLTKYRERVAKVPRAVIWLDDAEHPTRGEYYFSTIALDDPRSRLSEIRSEIVGVEEGSRSGRSVSDPANEVPWVGGGRAPSSLIAKHAYTLPDQWSDIPGLTEALSKLKAPMFIYSGKGISGDQVKKLMRVGVSGRETIHRFLWPSPDITVFNTGTGGLSDKYFERTRRVHALLETENGVIRFTNTSAKGVLLLTEQEGSIYREAVKVVLGDKIIVGEGMYAWTVSFLYDANTKTIVRLSEASLFPGKDGFAY